MGITARELSKGQTLTYNGRNRTVEHVAMHPAGIWVRFQDGAGESLTSLNAYGATIAGA